MGKTYFVDTMSNKSRRLYVGITNEFQARVFQHKNKWYEGSFTARYLFDMLVYFEAFSNPSEAIEREKKLRLIQVANPDWSDWRAEWEEDESWKVIPEAKFRPVWRRQPRKS